MQCMKLLINVVLHLFTKQHSWKLSLSIILTLKLNKYIVTAKNFFINKKIIDKPQVYLHKHFTYKKTYPIVKS